MALLPALSTPQFWLFLPVAIVLVLVWRLASAASLRRHATRRLFEKGTSRRYEPTPVSKPWASWLEEWLSVSGIRGKGVVSRYLVTQGIAFAVGMGVSLFVSRSGVLDTGVQWLREIPGSIGDLLAPVLEVSPWILFLLIGLMPITRIRARRRVIVQSVEQDLPMTLALLATLVESGLGFDAAIERILASLSPDRPLARELTLFRSETRAGVPRVICFRSLAQRLDIVSVSTFVSAMIHSEHVGGGLAESLRRQADEVWSRRRELAIQKAQTLPTKLAVPLVLCFLPGIFVYTFGPALAEFLRIAESVVSGAQ